MHLAAVRLRMRRARVAHALRTHVIAAHWRRLAQRCVWNRHHLHHCALRRLYYWAWRAWIRFAKALLKRQRKALLERQRARIRRRFAKALVRSSSSPVLRPVKPLVVRMTRFSITISDD